MKTIITAAMLLSLIILPRISLADERQPFDLYDTCQKEGSIRAACSGYIRWASEQIDVFPQKPCVPDDITGNQKADAVKSWLRQNPQYQNYAEGLLVQMALKEAWPCTRP